MIHNLIKLFILATTINVGQVYEESGSLSHTFVLHNQGADTIHISSSQTSCHCTSVHYKEKTIAPGDSLSVRVDFNMQGKGGEFLESATLQLVSSTDTLYQSLSLEGEVIHSAESLSKAYPVKVGNLRLSTTTLDFGQMNRGETKSLTIAVQNHPIQTITLKADEKIGWGQQQITRTINISGTKVPLTLKALIVDSAKGSQRLSTSRRLPSGTKTITLENTGNAPLIIHRIYTPKGDILNKDIVVAPNKNIEVPIPQKVILTDDDTQITIISNSSQSSRTMVRLQR